MQQHFELHHNKYLGYAFIYKKKVNYNGILITFCVTRDDSLDFAVDDRQNYRPCNTALPPTISHLDVLIIKTKLKHAADFFS